RMHFFQIEGIAATNRVSPMRLCQAYSQHIVDVSLHLFLKLGNRSNRQFRDAAAVESPAAIAVIQSDDDSAMRPIQPFDTDHGIDDALKIVTLRRIFQAGFVREAT